jgi:transcription elongation factor Elf1
MFVNTKYKCGKKAVNMSTQIHYTKLARENYNCIRCGHIYKSITSIRTTQDSIVIQIIECNKCGYLWKETWEQPMWRFYIRE